nr:hypothetical protein [Tanacetum cinerariifolium]
MITVTIREGEQQTHVIREKTAKVFTEAENNKELADIQAINILSQAWRHLLTEEFVMVQVHTEVLEEHVVRVKKWTLLHEPLSTQQDIYVAGSENRPAMLKKDNYVPWSSYLLRYAKSKPNRNLIYNSIMHGPYVRQMIPEPGDPDCEVPVAKIFHEQTDDELTDKEVKQTEAVDQVIQTILMGLLEDIYAAVDSCETA